MQLRFLYLQQNLIKISSNKERNSNKFEYKSTLILLRSYTSFYRFIFLLLRFFTLFYSFAIILLRFNILSLKFTLI